MTGPLTMNRLSLSGLQFHQLPGGPSIFVLPCGTSVRPCPKSSDAAAVGGEACFPAMGSASEVGRTEVVHPARTSSEARRMAFVIVAPGKEVTYYGRLSATRTKLYRPTAGRTPETFFGVPLRSHDRIGR
jgi:hypothetical protein